MQVQRVAAERELLVMHKLHHRCEMDCEMCVCVCVYLKIQKRQELHFFKQLVFSVLGFGVKNLTLGPGCPTNVL